MAKECSVYIDHLWLSIELAQQSVILSGIGDQSEVLLGPCLGPLSTLSTKTK